MEALEEGIMGRNVYVKGRRTKRMRNNPSVSSASSSEISGIATSEEEDMANCLILLAQGRALNVEGIFKCKTCNRYFPSFQALGGHRTSHKRTKTAVAVEDAVTTSPITPMAAIERKKDNSMKISFATMTNASGNMIGVVKSKVHECSICGSEFSSGQALGGHMRRHRSLMPIPGSSQEEVKKENKRTFALDLDLNLPAPSDDDTKTSEQPPQAPSSVISFGNRQAMIFSSLVNCHY